MCPGENIGDAFKDGLLVCCNLSSQVDVPLGMVAGIQASRKSLHLCMNTPAKKLGTHTNTLSSLLHLLLQAS